MAKGALTDYEKAALASATAEMAAALVDDLAHIREVISRHQPTPGDIRRLSNLLRRILIYDELRKVATARIGRIQIQAPDLNPVYRSNEKRPILFVMADSVNLFGMHIAVIMAEEGHGARQLAYDPDALTPLRLDTFQNQRVLCHQGEWVTRADVITYVANVAAGVHTTDAKEPAHLLLRKVRNGFRLALMDETIAANYGPATATGDQPIVADPNSIDVALLLLVGTAQHLVSSPDVLRLEEMVAASG